MTEDSKKSECAQPPVEEDLDWECIPEIPEGATLVPMNVVINKLVAQFKERRAARRAQVDQELGKKS